MFKNTDSVVIESHIRESMAKQKSGSKERVGSDDFDRDINEEIIVKKMTTIEMSIAKATVDPKIEGLMTVKAKITVLITIAITLSLLVYFVFFLEFPGFAQGLLCV